MALRLKVDYLVCEKICIPHERRSRARSAGGRRRPRAISPSSSTAMPSRVPGDGSGAWPASGLGPGRAAARRIRASSVAVASALPLDRPDLIVEGPGRPVFPGPQVALDARQDSRPFDHRREARRQGAAAGRHAAAADGGRWRRAASRHACRPRRAAAAALATALLAALLGGLILNLMPCVLPVLSLKLLAFVGHGETPREIACA